MPGQSLISRTVTDQPSLQLEPSGSLVSLVAQFHYVNLAFPILVSMTTD